MEPLLALLTENAFDAYKEIATAFNSIHKRSDNVHASVIYTDNIVHSGTVVIFEIGAGQHEAVTDVFRSVQVLGFVKYITDQNNLIRGIMYRFV